MREAVVTAAEDDAKVRLFARAMEMLEAVRAIEEALEKLPKGPTRAEAGFPVVAPGERPGTWYRGGAKCP